jgi:hypothetical protein
MSFEEKIDAMRMTLELAMHDIEAMGVKIEALRIASATQYESIQVLGTASEALLKNADRQEKNANRQAVDLRILKKISGDLVKTAQAHEQRIAGLEGRQ